MSYSVIKEEGPDNEQDKEASERASEEPEAVSKLFPVCTNDMLF